MWRYISGEAAGEIWNWSLLGMEGLNYSDERWLYYQIILEIAISDFPFVVSFMPGFDWELVLILIF